MKCNPDHTCSFPTTATNPFMRLSTIAAGLWASAVKRGSSIKTGAGCAARTNPWASRCRWRNGMGVSLLSWLLLTQQTFGWDLKMSWDANPASEEVTAYRLYFAKGTDGFSQWGTTTGITFTATGLLTNTTYRFQVRAVNSFGESPPSNTITNSGPASGPTGPPTAPKNLNATAMSASRIDLNWQDASTNETGFVIERSRDGATYGWLADIGENRSTYIDTHDLRPRKWYYYRVQAVNAKGASQWSNEAWDKTDRR